MDTEYAGTLSTLTKYGTLNVSVTRIPRKKRSRGNVAKPRMRGAASECISYFAADKSDATIFRNESATRENKKNKVRVVAADPNYSRKLSLSIAGNIGNVE